MFARALAWSPSAPFGLFALLLAMLCEPAFAQSQDVAAVKPLASFPMGPDRFPFITLSFGGKDYQCLIDTAASTTLLDNRALPDLGKAVSEYEGNSFYALPEIQLGSLRIPAGTPAFCRDFSGWTNSFGKRIDGLVGMGLLAKMAVTFDFDKNAVEVYEPRYRPTEPLGKAALVPQPSLPHALFKVCGDDLALSIRTASPDEIKLSPSLVEAYSKRGQASVLKRARDLRCGRLSDLGLAGSRYEGVVYREQRDNRTDGEVGLPFLVRCNPTLRIADNEIVLSNSKWRDGEWWPPLRGMTLVELAGKLVVFSVMPGSPAENAGLEPNDEVDLPTNFFRCSELWHTGSPLTLRVRRPTASEYSAVRLDTVAGWPEHMGSSASDSKAVDHNSATESQANTAAPLASFPMGPDRMLSGTLSFGGRDYRCVLDTGATVTVLNRRLESALGSPQGTRGGLNYYVLPAASLGGLQLPAGTIVYSGDLDDLSQGFGATIDALVGIDILSRVALSLNYDEGVVTLHEPNYRPTSATDTAKMHCISRPFTVVDVAGQESLMLVDTGSIRELGLEKSVLQKLCERGDAILLGKRDNLTFTGTETRRWGLLTATGLQGHAHEELHVFEQEDEHFEGLIGIPLLARYNSTLRFAHNELCFSKSKWYDARWWPDLRGMVIAEVGSRRIVFSVQPGSPAFKAGIRPNDEVDLPADFYSSWSSLFARSESAKRSFLANKLGSSWSLNEPLERRAPLWRTHGQLTLRVRKPDEADYTSVSLGVESGAPVQEFDRFVAGRLEARHLPGASIAVIKDGNVLYAKGFGLANVEKQTPATENSPYRMLGLTQSLTAAGTLLLVREGRLSLDNKITSHFSDLPEQWRMVTVGQLLNHSSGIESYEPSSFEGRIPPKNALELLHEAAAAPMVFVPGARHEYSYTNYLVLGLLIEKVSAQTYNQFVAERILAPLGMTSTRPIENGDISHSVRRCQWNESQEQYEASAEWAHPVEAAPFVSSLSDFVKWDAALRNHSLLDESTTNRMWSPTLTTSNRAGYGLGWEYGAINGRRFVAAGGTSAQIMRFLDDGLTVIVLTCADEGADNLALDIAGLFVPELQPQRQPSEDKDLALTQRLRNIVLAVQRGQENSLSLFAPDAPEWIADELKSLQKKIGDAGSLREFQLVFEAMKADRALRMYKASFDRCTAGIVFWIDASGQVDGIETRLQPR